jgi:small acid-soluble spore protein K (minor)
MHNKAKDFPESMNFTEKPKETDATLSKRADGTINDHPQERMARSNKEQ